jgi:ribosomal protein L40E
METRKFRGYNCDLTDLQNKIKTYFAGKNYRVTNFHKEKLYLTQAYKSEMGNKAIIAKIEGNPSEFDVTLGFGERIANIQTLQLTLEKIPFQTKLLLAEPTLENNFWNYFSTQADLRRNTYRIAKAKFSEFSPVWREREIVKEIEVVYCRYCGAKNNARMTSCVKCGANLC